MINFTAYELTLECIIGIFFLWIWSRIVKNRKKNSDEISDTEVSQILKMTVREPLETVSRECKEEPIERFELTKVKRPQVTLIKANTYDVYNLINSPETKIRVLDVIKSYGIGTCGPRGFLGTNDIHRKLEKLISQTLDTSDSVVYSYGFAALASVIPAYVKRKDIVFACRNLCSSGIMGLKASACDNIYWFDPDDLDGLEKLIIKVNNLDPRGTDRKKISSQDRIFFVVEACNSFDGKIIDLPRLVKLRDKYKIRIILDESYSFGVVGKSGRGITEYFNIPTSEIDIICCSMENVLGTIGGFSTGSQYVIDHQRLSSLAYCFSASLPTFQADLAIFAINKFTNEIETISALTSTANLLIKGLVASDLKLWNIFPNQPQKYFSPVKLTMQNQLMANHSFRGQKMYWNKVFLKCYERGVEVEFEEGVEHHLSGNSIYPGIRIISNVQHTKEDCDTIVNTIASVYAELDIPNMESY